MFLFALVEAGCGDEGGGIASLWAHIASTCSMLVGRAMGTTGSLAGTAKVSGPVEAALFSVEGAGGTGNSGSGNTDWDRDDGPAGSLAGITGKTRGPAD
jgi:hypothetical protein